MTSKDAVAMALGVTAIYPEWQRHDLFDDPRTIFEGDVYEIQHGFDFVVELRHCNYQFDTALNTWWRTVTILPARTAQEVEAAIEDLKARLPELTVLEVL